MCLSQDIATGHRKPNLLATADADAVVLMILLVLLLMMMLINSDITNTFHYAPADL